MKLAMNIWIPQEPDFELFHIYCHQKDYRLCFALNEHFKYDFSRINDFLEEEDSPALATYSQFSYADDMNHREYFVVSNQPFVKELVTKEGDLFATERPELLIPDMPKVDYFLLAYGQFTEELLNEMEDELNLIPLIITAKRVDPGSHPAYLNLMH